VIPDFLADQAGKDPKVPRDLVDLQAAEVYRVHLEQQAGLDHVEQMAYLVCATFTLQLYIDTMQNSRTK